MKDKVRQILEYDKVIHRLSQLAVTSIGKNKAKQLCPCSEMATIRKRLSETEEAVRMDSRYGQPSFRKIKDICPSLQRAKLQAMLQPKELTEIADFMLGSRLIQRYLIHARKEIETLQLNPLGEALTDFVAIEKDIRCCIGDEHEMKDEASLHLTRIRRDIRLSEKRIREKLDQILRSSTWQKMLQESLITLRNERYVLPVKQEYRSHFGGIVHDQSSSGATLFIEPEALVNMNNKLRELKGKEQLEIERILRELTGKVGEKADLLLEDVEIIGQIDFIFAKGTLAKELKATKPLINEEGELDLRQARHPLLDPKKAVPINVQLNERCHAMIITGPNTGGKTVTLKTIGLICLMSLSGLYVPAEEGSHVCVFEQIFADIGDEQSIEQNLSTFSSHMTNLIEMLQEVSSRSLVLLDEVGAGTDPAEGAALATSILSHLQRKKVCLVATTHYGELKAFAYNEPGIRNASMEFDENTLQPTYRLLLGVPGRSNAFAIAQRLGLPKTIVEQARSQLSDEELQLDKVIASMEKDRIQARLMREQAFQKLSEAQQMKEKMEAAQLKLEESKTKVLQKAKQEARSQIVKAKAEAESVISELRQLALAGDAVKDHHLISAKRRLEEAIPEQKISTQPKSSSLSQKIEVGDKVKVLTLGQFGVVTEQISLSEVTVVLGKMKMKTKLVNLELISRAKEQKLEAKSVSIQRTRAANLKNEINLRGMTLEEAIMDMDQFIDEAFLENLNQVYIIHGKGTGILRKGIQDFLRQHKHIKNFRLGQHGEGGTGVTVAELY